MFGFGKKNKSSGDDSSITQSQMAAIALEAIWKKKQEAFKEFSAVNIKHKKTKYEFSGHIMFFLEATPYDADFMGYNQGFIFGLGQAFQKDDEFCSQALVIMIDGYEKTIAEFVDMLELQHNPKPYSDLFFQAVEDNIFVDSENGSQGLAYGLVDGKGFGDFQKQVSLDYAKFNDPELHANSNLDMLGELLRQWKIGCALNSELMDAIGVM